MIVDRFLFSGALPQVHPGDLPDPAALHQGDDPEVCGRLLWDDPESASPLPPARQVAL